MGWGSLSRSPRTRLDFRSSTATSGLVIAATRAVLWLAVLLYGAHTGASVYEMMVVMPQAIADQPQSLRQWVSSASAAIRPMAYKEPAVLVLGTVSMVVLWLAMWRTAARGWMVLSGILGMTLVGTTVLFAFPILERTLRDGGAGLTDSEIVADVHAWQQWCRVRLVLLIGAWASSLGALLRVASRQLDQWLPRRTRL